MSLQSQEATNDSLNTTDQALLIKTIYTKKILSEVQE